MRTMRFLCWLALPAALLLGGLSAATAQRMGEGTAEARQACTPDAMRLCSEFIPNVEKVKACMLRKRGQLSEACRVAMRGGPAPRRVRRVRRVRRRVVHVRRYHRG
jgi:hypothetical protein